MSAPDPSGSPPEVMPAIWGIRPAVLIAGVVSTVVLIGWLLLATATEDRLVAGAAAAVTALATALGLTLRQRLTADRAGFTVRGPGGVRRMSWPQVVSIDAPARRRRGISSTSVEIDLDDDGLIVLGRLELGTDPAEVAQVLRARWVAGR